MPHILTERTLDARGEAVIIAIHTHFARNNNNKGKKQRRCMWGKQIRTHCNHAQPRLLAGRDYLYCIRYRLFPVTGHRRPCGNFRGCQVLLGWPPRPTKLSSVCRPPVRTDARCLHTQAHPTAQFFRVSSAESPVGPLLPPPPSLASTTTTTSVRWSVVAACETRANPCGTARPNRSDRVRVHTPTRPTPLSPNFTEGHAERWIRPRQPSAFANRRCH